MSRIRIYEKNKLDLSFKTNVTITVTDGVASNNGQALVNYMRDRNNYTGFVTTGSTNAGLTQLDINTGDPFSSNRFMMVKKNTADYTLQYYNGLIYTDFSTPISVVGETAENTRHTFDAVSANLFRFICQKTNPDDVDKIIRQMILTKEVGQFAVEPFITELVFNTGKNTQEMMSGKYSIFRKVGGVSLVLRFPPNKTENDQDLIFDLFNTNEGRLISITGGDDSDLPFLNPGFREEDYFFMAPINDHNTAFHNGRFANGVPNEIKLVEVV